jgi:MFS family permease
MSEGQVQAAQAAPSGMRAFVIVWFGQVVSLFGTAMSAFALTIWAWQVTGSAQALALVGFFSFAPTVIMSPLAGVLIDRWNRKLVMALSDLAAGLATIVVFALYLSGRLEIWHLYVTGAFTGIFQAFQWPAYSAAISTMLPKSQYARANGMISLADMSSGVAAPLLAGLLLTMVDVSGILAIDIITFVVALLALLVVRIPQPVETAAGREARGTLLSESGYGFRYILARPSLLGLQLVFFVGNLMGSLGFTLVAPMVLSRTGSDQLALGSIQSAAGLGGVIGGLLLSTWGGPKRKVHGVLAGHVLMGLFSQVLFGLGQSLPVWLATSFLGLMIMPVLNGSNQAIWQAKVAPDVQGRVFAVRRLIAQISAPVGTLAAGFLAEQVFEPGMRAGGALAGTFGWLVGSGPGAGMALLIVLSGVVVMAGGLAGYLVRPVREAEQLLPDHDALPVAAAAAS